MKRSLEKNRVLSIVVPIGLGIIFFVFFLFFIIRIDPQRTFNILITSKREYFILALLFDIGFMVFYAIAWYYLVKIILDDIKLSEAILVMLVSWFGDMVIPAAFITGEIIRIFFLKRKYDVEISKAAGIVVVHRLLSIIAFVLFMVLGIGYLILNGYRIVTNVLLQVVFFALLASFLAILCLLVIFKVELFERFSIKLFDKIMKLLKRKYLEKYYGHLEEALNSFKITVNMIKKSGVNIALSFVSLIIQWICGIMIPYTFFHSVNYHVSFWALAAAYPMYGVIDNIPFGIPANAGVLDAAMVSTFVLLGINKEIATAVTGLTRMVIVIFEAIVTGLVTLICGPRLFGISFSKLKEMLRERMIK